MARRDLIRYVGVGDVWLGFQTVGSGQELFYLPGWESALDWAWTLPAHARFLDRLASIGRLVLYDQRGKGVSERLPKDAPATLDMHVDDLIAITEAVSAGWRSTLFATNEGGFVAVRAAARYPNHFGRLILFAPSPVFVRTDDLPWESSPEQNESNIRSFERSPSWDEWWRTYLRDVVPSLAEDEQAIAWLASISRLTAPPGYSSAAVREMSTWDVRADLERIAVPTLVIHPRDSTARRVETARYVAERIADARLVELPGRDSYPWAGDADTVLDEVAEFVTGSRERPPAERRLATVLFTDLADSTVRAVELGDAAWRTLAERHHELIRATIRRHHGSEVDTAGDGFFATFEAPGRAVAGAREIVTSVRELGLDARAGVHIGEVETIDGKAGGIAVVIGARIAAIAPPGETLVSQPVKDLTAGSGLVFEDAGEHELKGVPDRWRLYRVVG